MARTIFPCQGNMKNCKMAQTSYIWSITSISEVETISQSDVENKCHLAATGAWPICWGVDICLWKHWLAQQKQQGDCELVLTAHNAS